MFQHFWIAAVTFALFAVLLKLNTLMGAEDKTLAEKAFKLKHQATRCLGGQPVK